MNDKTIVVNTQLILITTTRYHISSQPLFADKYAILLVCFRGVIINKNYSNKIILAAAIKTGNYIEKVKKNPNV